MSAGEGLLAAILEEPDKDDLRLIYADWLEEQGQEARAEFIRVQIALARNDAARQSAGPDNPFPPGRLLYSKRVALEQRERELLTAPNFWTWFGDYGSALGQALPGAPAVSIHGAYCTVWRGEGVSQADCWTLHIQRGCVESIALPCQDWLAHGPELVRQQPLRQVRLSDKEPTRAPPWFNPEQVGNFIWWWYTEDYPSPGPSDIPFNLWHCLGGSANDQGHKTWPTREEAEAALSRACLAWANQQEPAPCG